MIIMTYCLNSTELEEFLLSQLENKLIKNESLKIVIGSANQWEEKIWEEKILSLTFSFARILERHSDSMPLIQAMIKDFFLCLKKCS